MTKQEAYEKIRKHFSKPDAVYGYSADAGRCFYRVDQKPYSKYRCAVGCLIPDKKYDPRFDDDDWIVGDIAETLGWVENYIYDEERLVGFLDTVQSIHDNAAGTSPIAAFIQKLDRLAKEHRLQPVS